MEQLSSLFGGGGGLGPSSSATASNNFGGGDNGKWIAAIAAGLVAIVALIAITKG